jgi:hypothetical protein
MPTSGMAATSPHSCGPLCRDSSVTSSDMAPAATIDSQVALRRAARRCVSRAGRRGNAAWPNPIAQIISATTAAGIAGNAQVRATRAPIASQASRPASAACTARARRAKLAPSRTVSPVPHNEPQTADVA